MDAIFSITVDPAAAIVRITMSGFFGEPDIRRFALARDEAHRALLSAPNRHRTLVDIRGMKIQTQESVDAFGRLLNDPAQRSRRLAFIVEPGLARAQILRAAAGRGAEFFLSPGQAEAWLQEPKPQALNAIGDRDAQAARDGMRHVHH